MAVRITHGPAVQVRSGRPTERLLGALAWGALVALALWAAAPVVYLLARAVADHESFTGADSLFAADQLQYLAWIRSSGEHVLAGNGFALRLGGHVFLQPMFLISGLLWRAGMNIALSYLLWLPVAVGVMYFGFRKFTFHFLSSPGARTVALILALFFVTPADPAVGWTVGSNGLGTLAGELAPTGALYGYFPVAIVVGLSALFMLGVHLITDPARHRHSRRWYVGATAAVGMAAAWLHPWQGETALLVVAAIVVVGRFRADVRPLLIPAGAVALPLVYYLLLSRIDGAWKLGQFQSAPPRPNALLLLAALAPLVLPAAAGIRARRPPEPILWLWPAAAVVVYFISPGYAPHALEGSVLPLSVLAVRGWCSLRWPAWLGALAVAVSTLPGLAFDVHLFHATAVSDSQPMLLRHDETRALAYLARAPEPGGVLSSVRLAAAIPAYTGRRTWYGHASWTPDYTSRVAVASGLFTGHPSGAAGRALLHQIGARYLLADCEPNFNPGWLSPLLAAERNFGCVHVYELSVPNRAGSL